MLNILAKQRNVREGICKLRLVHNFEINFEIMQFDREIISDIATTRAS